MSETGLIVIEFLPDLRDFPICRMDRRGTPTTFQSVTGLGFRQACTYFKWDVNLPYK